MNSNKMKDCLATKGYKGESNTDRSRFPFKATEMSIRDLPLNSQTYKSPYLTQPGKIGGNHSVG